jgi:hypothetical protein
MSSNVKCPWCGTTNNCLRTPDYGFGYGAEFECHTCPVGQGGYRRFISHSPEAKVASGASLALSASNAAAIRGKGGL